MNRTFHSLRYPNYRLWFFGALVANTGNWMLRTVQSWIVLTELTDGDAVAVGVIMALQMGPALVLSPSAGALADRTDRRKLLMVTQGLVGLTALTMGILYVTGTLTLEAVYVLTLAAGVVAAYDSPARQTYVSDMVPPSALPNAVGLNSTSFNMARLVGPGAAGFLIAAIGSGWVLILTGVLFGGTVVALIAQDPTRLTPVKRPPREKGMIRAGFAYVKQRSDILMIMAVVGVVSMLGLNFAITSAVMSTEVFGKDAQEYGIVGSATAVGSLTGALLAARRERPRVRLVVLSAALFGIAMIASAVAPTFELYVLANVFVGLFTLNMLTSANATIQVSTAAMMRGRVLSLYMMVLLGTTPIGSPLVGWIANEFGGRWSVAVGGIVALLAAVGAAAWAWKNWHLMVEYHRKPRFSLRLVGPTERQGHDDDQQRAAE